MTNKFTFLLLLILTIASCDSQNKKDKSSYQEIEKEQMSKNNTKNLLIYFVDVSGSFNRRQEEGKFKNQNYFELACLQIKDIIRTKSIIGEDYLIVRAIKSSSFGDDATIAKLDLTDTIYIFNEAPPKEDIKKKRWKKNKEDFQNNANRKADIEREKAISEVNNFLDSYNDKPTNYTDLINALNSVNPIIESDKFKSFSKKIIVYSDFKETKNSFLSDLEINLDSVIIEGRFVSKNAFTNLKGYEKNKHKWSETLNCKKLIFKTPIESN